MPRSRGSEMPQRQSARLKTSTSDSDPTPHHRPIKDRSPKLGERRSPRSAPLSDSVNQKKLGTRISDLESQLGQAQVELKSLKDQLASAETARKEAQEELERKKKKPNNKPAVPNAAEQEQCKSSHSDVFEVPVESQQETDVFEVQVEKTRMNPKLEETVELTVRLEKESEAIVVISESEKSSVDDLALKKEEINNLMVQLGDKEQELNVFVLENQSLKAQLSEAVVKLSEVEEELKVSKTTSALLREKLEAVQGSKEELEAEMKKLRVQTEQWRKAADAAAAILSGGLETNGRIAERCGSMDNKHFGGVIEPPRGCGGEYSGFVVSPMMMADESDDSFGSSGGGKRKSSGIKKFGDLWKKKGQK